jgi:hypothetical protein
MMTRGQRLLLAVLQRTASDEIGARCFVSGRTVRSWVVGERNPTDEHRKKLESLYGIPSGAWGASTASTDPAKFFRS